MQLPSELLILLSLVKLMTRAELGRAAWKVLHLTTLRYPEVHPLLNIISSMLTFRHPRHQIGKRLNHISTSLPAYIHVVNAPKSSKLYSKNILPRSVPHMQSKTKLIYRLHPENQLQCGYAMSTISSMPDLGSLISIVSSWTRFTIVDVDLMGIRRYLVVV